MADIRQGTMLEGYDSGQNISISPTTPFAMPEQEPNIYGIEQPGIPAQKPNIRTGTMLDPARQNMEDTRLQAGRFYGTPTSGRGDTRADVLDRERVNREQTNTVLGIAPETDKVPLGLSNVEQQDIVNPFAKSEMGIRRRLSTARNDEEFENIFKQEYPNSIIAKDKNGKITLPDGNIYFKPSAESDWLRYTPKANMEELPQFAAGETSTVVNAIGQGALAAGAVSIVGPTMLAGILGSGLYSVIKNTTNEVYQSFMGTKKDSGYGTFGESLVSDLVADVAFGVMFKPAKGITNVATGRGMTERSKLAQQAIDENLFEKYGIPKPILSQETDIMFYKRLTAFAGGLDSRLGQYYELQREGVADAFVREVLNYDPPTELKEDFVRLLVARGADPAVAEREVSVGFEKLKVNAVSSKLTSNQLNTMIANYDKQLNRALVTWNTGTDQAAEAAKNIIEKYSLLSKAQETKLYQKGEKYIKYAPSTLGGQAAPVQNIVFDVTEAKKLAKDLLDGVPLEYDAKHIGYNFRKQLSDLENPPPEKVTEWYYAYKEANGTFPKDAEIKQKYLELGYDTTFKSGIDQSTDLFESDPLRKAVSNLYKTEENLTFEQLQRLRHDLIDIVYSSTIQGQTTNDWYSRAAKSLVGKLTDAMNTAMPNPLSTQPATPQAITAFNTSIKEAREFSKNRYALLDSKLNSRILVSEFPSMMGAMLDNKGREAGLENILEMVTQSQQLARSVRKSGNVAMARELQKDWENIQEAFKTSLLFDTRSGRRNAEENIRYLEANPTTRKIMDMLMPDKQERAQMIAASNRLDNWMNQDFRRLMGLDAPAYAKLAQITNNLSTTNPADAQNIALMLRDVIATTNPRINKGQVALADTVQAKLIQDTMSMGLFQEIFQSAAEANQKIVTSGMSAVQAKAQLSESLSVVDAKITDFKNRLKGTGFNIFFNQEKLDHIDNFGKIAKIILHSADSGQNLQSAELLAKLSHMPPNIPAHIKYQVAKRVYLPLLASPGFANFIVKNSKNQFDYRKMLMAYTAVTQPSREKFSQTSENVYDNTVDMLRPVTDFINKIISDPREAQNAEQ